MEKRGSRKKRKKGGAGMGGRRGVKCYVEGQCQYIQGLHIFGADGK